MGIFIPCACVRGLFDICDNLSNGLEIFKKILMKHIYSALFYTFVMVLPIWLIGFGLFVLYVFSFRFASLPATDAIVAWTGGEYRIQNAIRLLKEEHAHRLLISGINKSVSPALFLGDLTPEIRQKIDLGYQATTTKENAIETADWVYRNALRSVTLVTSFYHMPRSLLEFKHALPKTPVFPNVIWPKDFDESVAWIHTRSAFHLFIEYHKFQVVKLQYLWEDFLK